MGCFNSIYYCLIASCDGELGHGLNRLFNKVITIYVYPSAANGGECFLTRMQRISQDYMFAVDDEGRSLLCDFFGFNGKSLQFAKRLLKWHIRQLTEFNRQRLTT